MENAGRITTDVGGRPEGRPAGMELSRMVGILLFVRAAAAPLALIQVLIYAGVYPPGTRTAALSLCGSILVADGFLLIAHRRARPGREMWMVAVISLAVDIALAATFTWLYAFDPASAIWAILYLIPVEGALLFALWGALGAWAATVLTYLGRELYTQARFDGDFEISRVVFRMSLGLLIALATGLLARELMRQKRQLETALAEMTRIDRLRSTLVSTLAHDLRNPLTAIRGAHRTLMTRRVEPGHADELIAMADRHSERLQRLAIDLLDLARLEGGRLDLVIQPVDLCGAIENALTYVDRGEEFTVEVADGIRVLADPGRLQQMVVNLADNALRHGRPSFRIASSTAEGRVTIRVMDEGPGLPPEVEDRVFEPFGGHSEQLSVGFGLAIVRGLAEAHGGRAEYRHGPEGTTFELELPAA